MVHSLPADRTVPGEVDTQAGAAPLALCLHLMRAQAVATRRLDATLSSLHGLSFTDFTILWQLGRAEGGKLRRIDLAERLGLTASGVTRTLLPLEKLGWVARQPDPRDARVAHATLTEAGQRLLGNAQVSAGQACDALTASLTGAEREAMAAALERLVPG